MLVRFLTGFGVYNSGETAGFDDAEAKALVEAGVAEAVTGVEVPATAEAAPAAPKPRKPRNA